MKACLTLLVCLVTSLGFCQSNQFLLQIYKASVVDSANLFISPYSVREALLAVGAGARGDTKNQFDGLIGTHVDPIQAQELEIANSLWTNSKIHVKPGFVSNLTDDFHTEHFSFDPANIIEAGKQVNAWVTEKTHAKIKEMPGPTSGDAFVVMNATYFKDSWAIPFKRRQTKPRTFHAIDGKKEQLMTMYSRETYGYFENEDIQALIMPYNGDLEMIVLLPRKRSSLKELEQKVDPVLVEKIQYHFRYHPVEVFMPKFELRSDVDMMSVIQNAGLEKLFSATADYSGISDDAHVVSGALIHKTFLEIDEKHTEGAAVTEMVIVGGSGGEPPPPPEPKVFRADHPFMFLITDEKTGTIVFAGRFVRE